MKEITGFDITLVRKPLDDFNREEVFGKVPQEEEVEKKEKVESAKWDQIRFQQHWADYVSDASSEDEQDVVETEADITQENRSTSGSSDSDS